MAQSIMAENSASVYTAPVGLLGELKTSRRVLPVTAASSMSGVTLKFCSGPACTVTGTPHVLLEVRQDLIGDEAGIESWANRLHPIFAAMNDLPHLHSYDIHPSRAD